MDKKLFFEAIIKFTLGILIIGLLLFIPANTINYWNGWLFMGILFIPMFIAGVIMMIKSPDLLRKRLNAKEKEGEQKQVILFSGLMFLSGFLLFLSIPLILGSVISFVIFLVYPFIINKRIKNEEEILEKELEGYSEYKKKVKYKLIPFIW